MVAENEEEKNKMRKNCTIEKKVIMILLAFALVMTGIGFMPTEAGKVKAASDYVYTQEFDKVENYISNKVAPKPSDKDETHKGWLFAGWYTDASCTTVLTATTGKGTAKFVPAEVLSVGCQMLEGTTAGTDTSKLRIVSTVDSLDYQAVGFNVVINGKKVSIPETTKVYSSIVANEGGVAYTNQPTVFHLASAYFTTFTFTGIPKSAYNTPICITPYWITKDGTKVDGITRYARVEDGYLHIVNVPVRLYTDANVAAGYLEVSVPSGCEYVNYDSGIFEEMEVAANNGKVKIVGNVADISADKTADGLYANLRFRVTEAPADGAFTIINPDFCDKGEITQKLSVIEAAYNDFK